MAKNLKVGDRVRISFKPSQFSGKIGTITKIDTEGVFHTKLDDGSKTKGCGMTDPFWEKESSLELLTKPQRVCLNCGQAVILTEEHCKINRVGMIDGYTCKKPENPLLSWLKR